MILRFKQRFFSWFDSYDIYDENGNTVYVVKGQFSWGHCLKIFDAYGEEVGTVKERIFTFMPKFEMYFKNQYVGCISREFALFKPKYNVECNGWNVEGNVLEWGLYRCFRKRSRCGKHLQRAVQLDGHVPFEHIRPRRRTVRFDDRACDRRRKVQPK